MDSVQQLADSGRVASGKKQQYGVLEESRSSPSSIATDADSLETVGSDAQQIAEEEHLRPDETCIIFDWDDTLLSSSWLAHNGLRLDTPDILPPEATSQLCVLEDSVNALLERALRCGSVVIITNAETGWVELSCRKFLPRCLPLVSAIKVVSARSTFEALHPDSPSDWKVQAFFQEICSAYAGRRPDTRKNILSFGDSVHERAAVHRVTSNMGPLTRTKSIKFVERPTVEQLKRQVDLVASCLEEICRHDGHLDLMLTIQLLYNTPAAAATPGTASPAQQQQHNAGEITGAVVHAGVGSHYDAVCPGSMSSGHGAGSGAGADATLISQSMGYSAAGRR